MAMMYPKDIELFTNVESERKVFRMLRDNLSDDFTVFYSIPWSEKLPDGNYDNSECDFLILYKAVGFLTCEVKGGYSMERVPDGRYRIHDAKGDSGRILSRSPMRQSEQSMRYFIDLYKKKYHLRFDGVFGSVTFFPHYSSNDCHDPFFLDHTDPSFVLCKEDSDSLEKSIKKSFALYRTKSKIGKMSQDEEKKFLSLIQNKVAARAVASTILEEKQLQLSIANRVQDNLVAFIKNFKKTYITGSAGTGKSWIASKFATVASLSGKTVLVTFSNPYLKELYLQAVGDKDGITIETYEELAQNVGIPSDYLISSNAVYEFAKKNGVKSKYDCVIVDEAQDFDTDAASFIRLFLKDTEGSELRVFYDPTQKYHKGDFGDGFGIGHQNTFYLVENLRNTESIYKWASNETNLGKNVIMNQIIGPEPEKTIFPSLWDASNKVEEYLLRFVDDEGIQLSSFVMLVDEKEIDKFEGRQIGRWSMKRGKTDGTTIRISTVDDYKGLEADIVFYIHQTSDNQNEKYIAFTRAKFYLFEFIYQ